MTIPFYRGFTHPEQYPRDGHAGLWYDRFFNQYEPNGAVPDGGKLEWIKKITSSPLGGEKVGQFVMRQMALIDSLGGKSITTKTDWHFVTGMGINHPVENGFAWHPTLGVPYMTGAAVKGLLRAWCEQWSSEFDNDKQAEKLCEWFGTSIIDPAAGKLIFFDAIPTRPVKLQADVMTPHYGDWYEKGDTGPKADGSNVPADWHNPVPVPFLAVAPGQSFLFSVAARPGCSIDLDNVLKELKDALEWLGAGAKTAVGYGRMEKDEGTLASLQAEIRKKREELQRKEELSAMTPLEREIAEILDAKTDKNIKDYVLLLQKLESGYWSDDDEKKRIAGRIRTEMEKEKVWRATSNRPEKDKDHKRTIAVMKYLQ